MPVTPPVIWTLEKRLGYALAAMLQADTGIFNNAFGDRVEFATDYIDVDEGQGSTMLIKPDLPQDPVRQGRTWAEVEFHFMAVIRNWDDRQMRRSLSEGYQMLDVALRDEAAYFETHLNDEEENLCSLCGKITIRHELNNEDLNDTPMRQTRIIVKVTHKRPLAYSVAA